MQKTCEGCARVWRVEAPQAPLSLLSCPYTDCRCWFVIRGGADSLQVQRARSFYRRRAKEIGAQFDEESSEARAGYFLSAAIVTMVLSLVGVAHWVGASWAFFLALLLVPLVLLVGLEKSSRSCSSLGWLYLLSSLLVISALTPSPLEFAYMLPHLALHGLTALLVIMVSSSIGGLVYTGLRFFYAEKYAQQAVREEKRQTPRIEAKQVMVGFPYR